MFNSNIEIAYKEEKSWKTNNERHAYIMGEVRFEAGGKKWSLVLATTFIFAQGETNGIRIYSNLENDLFKHLPAKLFLSNLYP